MRNLKFIVAMIAFVLFGSWIESWATNKLRSVPAMNDFGKINRAMNDSTPLTIWGSSTAYMNVIPDVLEHKTKLETYNFGIGGAAYDQLHHLFEFSAKNKKKTIVWVVNPYELENYDYKLQEEELFIQWLEKPSVQSMYQRQSLLKQVSLNLSSWYYISQLNSKHWNYIFNPSINKQKNEKGFIGRTKIYNETNNFYPTDEFTAIEDKILRFKKIAKKVAINNHLIVVIPPALNQLGFEKFRNRIVQEDYKVLNFANNQLFRDTLLYQDNVHLNISGATLLSELLSDSLNQLLSQ